MPAGPYLRGDLVGASLSFEGLADGIQGDFSFEQITNSLGQKLVRLAATEISVDLESNGESLVTLTNGTALFVLGDDDLFAGTVSGTASISGIPGVQLQAGALSFETNHSSSSIDESYSLNDQHIELVLPAGPYTRFTGQELSLIHI